ncbi:MAG: ABC transporter substrate-binding protein [Firmicutes bacterium]|nr:ABC transporter substrate-binding protein [Bacillota bacterium]
MKKFIALLLALCMVACLFAGCKEEEATTPSSDASTTASTPEASTDNGSNESTPLVVGYLPFSEKFSPFYADTAYDQDVVGMVSLGIMTTDRTGAIVYNAIEGETIPYNGTDYTYTGPADISVNYDDASDTTTYHVKIRDDLVFSDGEPLTAKDILFTYYVLCDPTYAGSSTLYSVDIQGLQNYRTQTTDEVYAKYAELADGYFEAGAVDEADELSVAYYGCLDAAWADQCMMIVNYVNNNYAGYQPDYMPDGDLANEADQIAFGMVMWGFGATDGEGNFTYADAEGDVTKAISEVTIDDYVAATKAAYENDPVAFFDTEATGEEGASVVDAAKASFISTYGPQDEAMGGKGVTSISGITMLNDYEVEVVANGFDAAAVYQVCGITVAPMHYYGDASKWNPDEGQYGFDFQDLSGVQAKTTQPLGAGPYKFVKYENRVVYFEANELYYKGCPKTVNVQFKETLEADKISGIDTGVIDITDPSGSVEKFNQIRDLNSNGELSGDRIYTNSVDNLGYGYIGLNADTMCVGDDPSSEASKDLRKAFATVIAVYREMAIDSYYGDAASVIEYPISSTSWAAPQASDPGYQLAYSVDVDGNPIYTADMTPEEKYEAARNAALGFFEAAGFTVEDGKVVAAPEGASLEYQVIIPGDGSGDHPSFAILQEARDSLAQIGITMVVYDPADSNELWDALDAGTQNMWCAAWGATIDPDMYQVYYSTNVVGDGGSDSNHYHIRDNELDKLIVEARTSDDQSFRKATYKECLDIILDWAVEVPVYQRQNIVIASEERVNTATITPDITTFYGWMAEIENLEMK